MADICDMAQPAIDAELERNILAAQRAPMPVGNPGDCEICGEWSGRLVDACCAPCRTRHRLN